MDAEIWEKWEDEFSCYREMEIWVGVESPLRVENTSFALSTRGPGLTVQLLRAELGTVQKETCI